MKKGRWYTGSPVKSQRSFLEPFVPCVFSTNKKRSRRFHTAPFFYFTHAPDRSSKTRFLLFIFPARGAHFFNFPAFLVLIVVDDELLNIENTEDIAHIVRRAEDRQAAVRAGGPGP